MKPAPSSAAIAEAFHESCLAELEALKPGNVHRFADGHRMRVADFQQSAAAAAPAIAAPGDSVGKRVRLAVQATSEAVGQNTNLGIILLAAPLAQAALTAASETLEQRTAQVLAGLTIDDARDVYAAIRRACPGGLGKAARHDVANEPAVTLLEAMREAEAHDRIAWNYTHRFADIFGVGLPKLVEAAKREAKAPWPVTAIYLHFLASCPDTLIARKFGSEVAMQVAGEAKEFEARWIGQANTMELFRDLLAFDRRLKERGLNPGTTADLTVATLFAARLERLEERHGNPRA